jgi:hypothetical protein
METQANLKPWQPGQSGNPNGRPVGSRSAFSAGFTRDLAEVWAKKGKASMSTWPTSNRLCFSPRAHGCYRAAIDVECLADDQSAGIVSEESCRHAHAVHAG